MLENYWGTCRFNLYYLTGVLLTDLAGLLLGYSVTSTDLNLSLVSPSQPSRPTQESFS